MNFRIFDLLRFALWRIPTPIFFAIECGVTSRRVWIFGFPLVKNHGAISLDAVMCATVESSLRSIGDRLRDQEI